MAQGQLTIRTGFSPITSSLFRESTIQKGKELIEARHMKNMEEIRDSNGQIKILGRCIHQTSVHALWAKIVGEAHGKNFSTILLDYP